MNWDADEEGMQFTFEFQRTGKKPRQVRVNSPYVSSWLFERSLWIFSNDS